MQVEQISDNVASALAHLEEAVNPKAKLNEEEIMWLTWKAASDLEYCLFLFSFIDKEAPSSSWKLPKTKQPDLTPLLTSTLNLLKEAANSLEGDNLKEAHKKTWLARGLLHRIHDFFGKKQGKTRKHVC